MLKRFLALALLCLLMSAGVPAVESAPLCAQVMPECCCIEAPVSETVFTDFGKTDTRSTVASSDSDDSNISLEPEEQTGHNDCCCEVSDPRDTVDAIIPAPTATVDLAGNQTPVLDSSAFPLHTTLSIGASAHTRRPLHLATNKVYLLKRSFLI
ncbi:MAG: hypothetical protein K2W95_19615 [Candidatus Obscuribacterales bacterium]|nr:hypothetical protein [Candidatus Obscuribacterales bacterium]